MGSTAHINSIASTARTSEQTGTSPYGKVESTGHAIFDYKINMRKSVDEISIISVKYSSTHIITTYCASMVPISHILRKISLTNNCCRLCRGSIPRTTKRAKWTFTTPIPLQITSHHCIDIGGCHYCSPLIWLHTFLLIVISIPFRAQSCDWLIYTCLSSREIK